jgi:hypothetical protein
MKSYTFKIGKREYCIETNSTQTAYLLAEAYKEHNKLKGKVILIFTSN